MICCRSCFSVCPRCLALSSRLLCLALCLYRVCRYHHGEGESVQLGPPGLWRGPGPRECWRSEEEPLLQHAEEIPRHQTGKTAGVWFRGRHTAGGSSGQWDELKSSEVTDDVIPSCSARPCRCAMTMTCSRRSFTLTGIPASSLTSSTFIRPANFTSWRSFVSSHSGLFLTFLTSSCHTHKLCMSYICVSCCTNPPTPLVSKAEALWLSGCSVSYSSYFSAALLAATVDVWI